MIRCYILVGIWSVANTVITAVVITASTIDRHVQDVLSSDRRRHALTLRVRDYYTSERLYLLRCLKHLLSFYSEKHHPYSVSTTTETVIATKTRKGKGDSVSISLLLCSLYLLILTVLVAGQQKVYLVCINVIQLSQNNLVSVGYSTMWRMVNFIRVKVQYKSELQVLWILQFSWYWFLNILYLSVCRPHLQNLLLLCMTAWSLLMRYRTFLIFSVTC